MANGYGRDHDRQRQRHTPASGPTVTDGAISWLEQHAAQQSLDLADFWAGADVVSDCGVIDPAVELATRLRPRLEAGEPFQQAIRTAVDDALAQAPRNSG
jgi:hypothetical protein